MVLEAALGTPSVSLLSVFSFCWFFKEYMASANSAFQAKTYNFVRRRAEVGPQLTPLTPGVLCRVAVFLH